MSNGSSTLRSARDHTAVGSAATHPVSALQQKVEADWRTSGHADLVATLRLHPRLLQDRSVLLELAVQEFRMQRETSEISDLERYCGRFREFGGSIERSILRQLEAQRYIDDYIDVSSLFAEPKWPCVGEEFGEFYILEQLGAGSQSRVYLTLQTNLGNRKVVIKVTPHAGIEASILGRLEHPNIVAIFSTGFIEEVGLYYLCMPYCGRSTLADLLDVAFADGLPCRDESIAIASRRWESEDETLSKGLLQKFSAKLRCRPYIDQILRLAIQIAEALEKAHQHRILHGDLKPSNVLLTSDSQPILLDFNLSLDFANSLRRRGGTLPYMPPENLQVLVERTDVRERAEFDSASDVFSFGALLYELLTGRTPVILPATEDNSSRIANYLLCQLELGVQPIRTSNPLVSPTLESIVLQCLAFDRHDRPASMTLVKRSLNAERRWLAAAVRRARVQPTRFIAAITLPILIVASGAAYVAIRPDAHIVSYRRGIDFATAGNLREATATFTEAIDENPTFEKARFERGRARLGLGELDLAMDDFGILARNGDARSVAYIGYCFNLKRVPVAAIPWYERAIKSGHGSVAIYNNLGASYLVARTNVTQEEQLRRADLYLLKALELENGSITIRLNLVRLAIAKSKSDTSYDPLDALPHVDAIIASGTLGYVLRYHLGLWHRTVMRYHSDKLRQSTDVVSDADRPTHESFARIQDLVSEMDKESPPGSNAEPDAIPVNACFLEPLWLHGKAP